MRKPVAFALLAGAFGLCLADMAAAQMGGQMGEMGQGSGGGRGGGGHHRGNRGAEPGRPGGPGGPPPASMQPAASVPASMRLTGVIIVACQTKTIAPGAVTTAKADQSALFAEREAQVQLTGVQMTSTSTLSMLEDGRDWGLASALLVTRQARVTMDGGSIVTEGNGVNGIFAADPGSQVALKGVSIATRAANAYGVQIGGGASLQADGVKVTTGSDHAPAVAIQDADSQASLTGGDYTTNGPLAPAIFAAGTLNATGIVASARQADAIVVEGPQKLILTGVTLSADRTGMVFYGADSSAPPAPAGIKASSVGASAAYYSPNAQSHPPAIVVMEDGVLKARGQVFSVSNLKADITLTHVDVETGDGILVRASAAPSGPLGRNGGEARLEAHKQVLNGDFVTDVLSNISVDLRDGSQLTGKTTTNVDVALDESSTWTLTADTKVGKVTGAVIAGDQVSNIIGNGHRLAYDPRYNAELGGKSYQLAGGGMLVPGDGL